LLLTILLLNIASARPWSQATPTENFSSSSGTSDHNQRQIFIEADKYSANTGIVKISKAGSDENRAGNLHDVIKFDTNWDYVRYDIASADLEDGLYEVYISYWTDMTVGDYSIGVDDGSINNWKEYWYLPLENIDSDNVEFVTARAGTIHLYDDVSTYQFGMWRAEASYDLYIDEITLTAW